MRRPDLRFLMLVGNLLVAGWLATCFFLRSTLADAPQSPPATLGDRGQSK